ncbi:hypothetical protein M8C21_020386 [Ambrosia artemisiifolia]|uniref:Multiple myeloma tumor-associated protein 2-like N-terminal domain-containing protein n=1 Tax=Ambrosia artemisiifolia TaxID=4212 RepID=A0AAD5BML4_AMBAR|nr:hypothetical protein M8C21_020386 [Ambrosia artemisiifolia]
MFGGKLALGTEAVVCGDPNFQGRGNPSNEFSWDDVKVDKYRENYIGHSLKAPVGRWQKDRRWPELALEKKSS